MMRKLGYFEAYCASVDTCIVSMVAVLSNGQASSRLTDAAIHRGVNYIENRHPHLRSTLCRDEDGDLCLQLPQQKKESTSSSDLIGSHFEIVMATSANGWQDIVHQESNIGFDLNGSNPYWKVVFIRASSTSGDNDVLLIKYHHAIADGTSGYILINDFLTAASSMNSDQKGDATLPMLPSIDDMCFPAGRTPQDEKFVESSLSTLRKKRTDWFPRLKYSPTPPAGNAHSMLYRDGTEDGLNKLLETCRSRGVTIGAVLGAATYFVVAKMNNCQDPPGSREFEEEDNSSFHFDFDMDVNLRKRLPKSLGSDHVGAFIGMMSFNLSLEPSTAFWNFVHSMHRAIQDALNERQHFHYLEVNKRLDKMLEKDPLENRCWKVNDGHVQDMNFSNIGRYPFSPDYDGGISVEKIYCVGGGWCPTFGAYVFLIPSVRYLNFSLVYESDAETNDAVANEFFNSVCDLVERAPSVDDSFTLEQYLKG